MGDEEAPFSGSNSFLGLVHLSLSEPAGRPKRDRRALLGGPFARHLHKLLLASLEYGDQ